MATERPLILSPDAEGLSSAATLLQQGKLVAIPTETVYGLGGNATSDDAVAAIFEAKGRPAFNPLIIHFADKQSAWLHVAPNETAEKLAAAFWPGPLTMVLPRRSSSSVSLLASAGLDTLAVRVPAHPVVHAVLETVGCPIAAPSANRSGSISPTLAEHVCDSLGTRVDAVVDGGPCDIGVESSVVAVLEDKVVLLRPGGITREEIEAVIGSIDVATTNEEESGAPRSPGMLERHYAPATPVRLNALTVEADEAYLGFGENGQESSTNLSEQADLREAAANLFSMMRHLDSVGASCIAIAPIPETGLGVAINDRLRRAATPESP